ncbi:MAG: hypothetical protein HC827_04515 [Cyanobacteria bacterium RM1_2_2]|nr:hypothetical protein [Cyanobacteria bacterium RM1_2_2]
MGRISDLVQQALETGYLTLTAEDQLRSLLQTKNDPEELTAFMQLQQAAMEGNVRQESREAPGISRCLS